MGFLVALAGCSSGDDDSKGAGGAGGSGGSGGTPAMCVTTITSTDANNYKFQSNLTIDVTKVEPGANIHFDWSGATKDLLGHDLDLSKVDMVEVALWNLTLDQFETKLNNDSLAQSDLAIIASILPNPAGATSGNMFDLTSMGAPLTQKMITDYLDINTYPPANHLYTAMVANGMTYGKETRMLTGFQLDSTSTNTQVNITSDSTKLSLTADLHTLTSPAVPAGNPALTVDWTGMTKTSSGLPFDPTYITQLRVGKYSKSVSDLEVKENFLSLDSIADTMYSAVITSGTSFDLSKAKDPSGNPFPGIDDTHTWIVALNCTDQCSNPAPWYLTVLKPCAQ